VRLEVFAVFFVARPAGLLCEDLLAELIVDAVSSGGAVLLLPVAPVQLLVALGRRPVLASELAKLVGVAHREHASTAGRRENGSSLGEGCRQVRFALLHTTSAWPSRHAPHHPWQPEPVPNSRRMLLRRLHDRVYPLETLICQSTCRSPCRGLLAARSSASIWKPRFFLLLA
jgi:hypothetical protein